MLRTMLENGDLRQGIKLRKVPINYRIEMIRVQSEIKPKNVAVQAR